MLKLIGSLAVGAMLLVSCTSTALLSSGSPTPSAGAASPAADLRTHLNLLMGEHVFIVANDISRRDIGFGSEYNEGVMLFADGARETLPRMTKREMGDRILDLIVPRLQD